MKIDQKAFNTAIDVLAGEFPPESGITIEVLKRLCTAYEAAKTEQPVRITVARLDELERVYESTYNQTQQMNFNLLSPSQRQNVCHREALHAVWVSAQQSTKREVVEGTWQEGWNAAIEDVAKWLWNPIEIAPKDCSYTADLIVTFSDGH